MANYFWGTNDNKKAALRTQSFHRIEGEKIRLSVSDGTFIEGYHVDLDIAAADNLVKHLQSLIRKAKLLNQ